jgi:hypothetical protein
MVEMSEFWAYETSFLGYMSFHLLLLHVCVRVSGFKIIQSFCSKRVRMKQRRKKKWEKEKDKIKTNKKCIFPGR